MTADEGTHEGALGGVAALHQLAALPLRRRGLVSKQLCCLAVSRACRSRCLVTRGLGLRDPLLAFFQSLLSVCDLNLDSLTRLIQQCSPMLKHGRGGVDSQFICGADSLLGMASLQACALSRSATPCCNALSLRRLLAWHGIHVCFKHRGWQNATAFAIMFLQIRRTITFSAAVSAACCTKREAALTAEQTASLPAARHSSACRCAACSVATSAACAGGGASALPSATEGEAAAFCS